MSFASASTEALCSWLAAATSLDIHPASVTTDGDDLFFAGRRGADLVAGQAHATGTAPTIQGQTQAASAPNAGECQLTLGEASPANAAALRARLAWLNPVPCQLAKSAGTGDRLGIATPGHIGAFEAVARTGADGRTVHPLFPVLAQQSIRENDRTGRTPREVVDDAMWGVLQCGWRHGYGADADHLKEPADIDVCHAAGFTFFTIDPGDRVDDEATACDMATVRRKVAALDWTALDSSPADLCGRLVGLTLDLGGRSATLSEEDVLRAAGKYGPSLSHTVRMWRHLDDLCGDTPYDLEMSVDETATVTSLTEHIYIGAELQRLAVPVVSLAPRYTGMFEKGVDFIGDLDEFAGSWAEHIAVSQRFGPYKLSLHSGSDKFSIYPIAAERGGDLIHLKTAGTSYLEAVRTIGHLDPDLMRRLLAFAVERYPEDRKAYHVSAELARMDPWQTMADGDLPTVLNDFHTRQVLHVTFGSVLNDPDLRPPFMATLRSGAGKYNELLTAHFIKHLQPFA